ncbi:MAG: hypothetical protein M3Q03_13545 [Chloroflexota bacterium]|nr:hypothetical protein [Chloroflexota bacterium]
METTDPNQGGPAGEYERLRDRLLRDPERTLAELRALKPKPVPLPDRVAAGVEAELAGVRASCRATVRKWHREEARRYPESGLARARSIVEEHSLDPSAWSRLLSVRKHNGRKGAVGFLLGLGVPPEVTPAIMVALTDRACGVSRRD